MECNTKYTMFENYHTAAKEFANGDMNVYGRLMYILNCYGIENIVLDDLTPVEKLFFTGIRANIDKSLEIFENTKKGGAPKGNKNACKKVAPEVVDDVEKQLNNCQNNSKTTPNNYQTNEEEEEREEEVEGEREVNAVAEATSLSPSLSALYSSEVFNVFSQADLPCCNKNPVSFLQRDFKNGVQYLHKTITGLHSDDVIQACKNYVQVLNTQSSWFTNKYGFERFVRLKNFVDFLPDNFRIENFLKDGEKKPPDVDKPKVIELPAVCSDCGAKLEENNRIGNKTYFCTGCRSNFKYGNSGWIKEE